MDLVTRARTKVVQFQGVPLEIQELPLRDYLDLLGMFERLLGQESLAEALALPAGPAQAALIRRAAEGFPDAVVAIVRKATVLPGLYKRRLFGLLGPARLSKAAVLAATPSETMGLLGQILEVNDVLTPLKKKLQALGLLQKNPTPSTGPSLSAPGNMGSLPIGSGNAAPAAA